YRIGPNRARVRPAPARRSRTAATVKRGRHAARNKNTVPHTLLNDPGPDTRRYLGIMLQLEGVSALVLVEGRSDKVALQTLAARRGRDLAAEGASIVPIGGAQAIGPVLRMIQASGVRRIRLAGLCDAAEEVEFRRALERAGLGRELTRGRIEALGF